MNTEKMKCPKCGSDVQTSSAIGVCFNCRSSSISGVVDGKINKQSSPTLEDARLNAIKMYSMAVKKAAKELEKSDDCPHERCPYIGLETNCTDCWELWLLDDGE